MYPLFALLTPLPRIPFTTEEITGCTNEAAKGANQAPRNPPSCFFIYRPSTFFHCPTNSTC